jgi:gluconate 5-dehydrogenase
MKNAITELFNLTGKTAFVTGANSGIGKDACIAYAQAGANVILLDIVDATKLATELSTKYHVETLSVIANVGNEKEVEVAVATALKKFPKIDILLNNAGIAVPGTVDRMSLEK